MSKTKDNRKNAYDIVNDFEKVMCNYTGAPYAVAVDTCTAALFLCLKWWGHVTNASPNDSVGIPKRTFIGVANSVVHAGYRIRWTDHDWVGSYLIEDTPIIDSALHLYENMYPMYPKLVPQSKSDVEFLCLSFQERKQLKIGRGGMILHNSLQADQWFRRARFFGRHEVPAEEETGPTMIGWQEYMDPDRAAKGITMMMHYPRWTKPLRFDYEDLSQYRMYDPHLAHEEAVSSV